MTEHPLFHDMHILDFIPISLGSLSHYLSIMDMALLALQLNIARLFPLEYGSPSAA